MCSIFHVTWWIFDELFGFPTGSLGFNIGSKTKETKWHGNYNIVGLCNFVWCIYTEILETNVWGYCGLQKFLFGEDLSQSPRRTRNSRVRMQALKLASSVETWNISKTRFILVQPLKKTYPMCFLNSPDLYFHITQTLTHRHCCKKRQSNAAENVYVTDAGGHIMLYQIRYDAGVGVTASNLAVSTFRRLERFGWWSGGGAWWSEGR